MERLLPAVLVLPPFVVDSCRRPRRACCYHYSVVVVRHAPPPKISTEADTHRDRICTMPSATESSSSPLVFDVCRTGASHRERADRIIDPAG